MTPARLKWIRAVLGWSQTRLAEAIGVRRNTITRWEMGLNPIPPMAEILLENIATPLPTRKLKNAEKKRK